MKIVGRDLDTRYQQIGMGKPGELVELRLEHENSGARSVLRNSVEPMVTAQVLGTRPYSHMDSMCEHQANPLCCWVPGAVRQFGDSA
jgi:hypothetical protein